MRAISKILSGTVVRLYLFNSFWMMAEQILRIISGVFIGIYIARYLGPEQYGVLSYVLAFATFMMAIARLGMDAILIREIVSNPEEKYLLMGTAFWLMTVVALVCFASACGFIWLSSESTSIKIYAIIIVSGMIFTSCSVMDFYFQSQVQAKYSAICKAIALFLTSVLKIYLICVGADLSWFVLAFLMDYAVLGIIFIAAGTLDNKCRFLKCFSGTKARQMLRSAWPLVLGAIAIQVYMRIDQLMIRSMLGLHEVGIYSAAVRIYEAWVIVTAIITVSLLPAIVKLKQGDEVVYHKRMTQLFRLVIWLSIFAAATVCLISETLTVMAFGEAYRASAPVVDIVMWTAVFAAMGSVSARYFNVENMEKKFALRTALAAILNVGLNFLLIPLYGIKGAAIATLICTFFANYMMDWFDRDLKLLLKIKHRAVFGHPFN